jgi:type I restriction enzyme S subunit
VAVKIPSDWETKAIGDITECLDNRRIPIRESDRKSVANEFPYCGANGVLGFIDDYIFDEELILIAEDGGNFYEWEHRPIAYKMSGKYWVNNHAHVLKAKNIDQNFLFYTLQHKDITSWLVGGTRAKLNRGVLDKITIIAPQDIAEQIVIAKALSDIDKLIEQASEELIKQSNLFISVSEQLLDPSNNTEVVFQSYSLGKLGTTFGGLNGKSGKDFGTGSEYVTFLNVMNNLVLNPSTVDYVEIGISEAQNKLRENDLVFNGSSETPEEAGLTSVVPKDLEGAYLNSFCFGFRFSKIKEIDPKYFALLSRSSVGRQIIGLLAQGSTRYNISKTELLKVLWPIPPVDIQINTVVILTDILELIENTKLAKAKYECIKQGMAQDLLTGKVRLV